MTYRIISFFLFAVLLLFSCNDCYKIECAPPVSFQISIIDLSTGSSLLIQSDSIYNVDEMSITSLVDGHQIDGQLYNRNSVSNDSFPIICWSNSVSDMMFLKLNEEDTDTLAFISQYIENECCDVYRLDSVSINGADNIPVLNETIALLK